MISVMSDLSIKIMLSEHHQLPSFSNATKDTLPLSYQTYTPKRICDCLSYIFEVLFELAMTTLV